MGLNMMAENNRAEGSGMQQGWEKKDNQAKVGLVQDIKRTKWGFEAVLWNGKRSRTRPRGVVNGKPQITATWKGDHLQ